MTAQLVENPVFQEPVHQLRLLQFPAVSDAKIAMWSPQTKDLVSSLNAKAIKLLTETASVHNVQHTLWPETLQEAVVPAPDHHVTVTKSS